MLSKTNYKGFTMTEMLTVLAIVSILAALTAPLLLGAREKARTKALIASADGVANEIVTLIDSMNEGMPFIALSENGSMQCFQAIAAAKGRRCEDIYSGANLPVSELEYINVDDLVTITLNHHKGKKEYSPYKAGISLFSDQDVAGAISIKAVGKQKIQILAIGVAPVAPIYSAIVTTF